MLLYQALRYPFQEKGWFRRILILALLQLLPIIGQLILLGYGMDIVRSVYAGQSGLPPLRWRPALGNGFRFLLAGCGYLLPLLITIAIVGASRSGSSSRSSNLGILGIVLAIGLPLTLFLIRTVFVRKTGPTSIRQSRVPRGNLRSLLTALLPIVVTILGILLLRMLVSSSGIDTGKPNGLSILLLVVLALLVFLIGIALYVGGVRYAIENKGLLAPTTNAQLLLKNRAATGILFLNVILLTIIAVLTMSVGLILFILPGLFAFVVCSLALWYLFACYGKQIGIQKPHVISEEAKVAVSQTGK